MEGDLQGWGHLLKVLRILAASWEVQTGWRSWGRAGWWHTEGRRLLACRRGLGSHCISSSLSFFTDSSCTWKPWYWGWVLGRWEMSDLGPGAGT